MKKTKDVLIKIVSFLLLYPFLLKLITKFRSITGIFVSFGIDRCLLPILNYFNIDIIWGKIISLGLFILLFTITCDISYLIAGLMAIGIIFELYELILLMRERIQNVIQEVNKQGA